MVKHMSDKKILTLSAIVCGVAGLCGVTVQASCPHPPPSAESRLKSENERALREFQLYGFEEKTISEAVDAIADDQWGIAQVSDAIRFLGIAMGLPPDRFGTEITAMEHQKALLSLVETSRIHREDYIYGIPGDRLFLPGRLDEDTIERQIAQGKDALAKEYAAACTNLFDQVKLCAKSLNYENTLLKDLPGWKQVLASM
jgi:hypothetical protein